MLAAASVARTRAPALALDTPGHARSATLVVRVAARCAASTDAVPEHTHAVAIALAHGRESAQGPDAHRVLWAGVVGLAGNHVARAGVADERHAIALLGAHALVGTNDRLARVAGSVAILIGLVGVGDVGAVVVFVEDAVAIAVVRIGADTNTITAGLALRTLLVVGAQHELDLRAGALDTLQRALAVGVGVAIGAVAGVVAASRDESEQQDGHQVTEVA